MSSLLDRLLHPKPLVAVELRPPRKDLAQGLTMDSWMAMRRAVDRLLEVGAPLFFTDDAVGASEEENLHHLVSNLDQEIPRDLLCPFLTTKHTWEYCLWYADRAVSQGHSALTVLGGDRNVGPARCVTHAYQLRQEIRLRHPDLALGGWANPYRDPADQVGYLMERHATADFYLTQIVNHYQIDRVARFKSEAARQGLTAPGVFGVFYYRSANPKTLALLSRFLNVPAREVTADFEAGRTADEICAATIVALRREGVDRVYLSNLYPSDAPERLESISRLVEAQSV